MKQTILKTLKQNLQYQEGEKVAIIYQEWDDSFDNSLKQNFDNINSLKDFNNEIIIFHGINDKTVPVSHSEELFKTLQAKNKEYISIENTGHNDVFDTIEFKQRFDELMKN